MSSTSAPPKAAAAATAAGGSGVGPSRRKWDVEEYTAKAKARDDEDRDRAKENQERLLKGKRPVARRQEDLPKPTELLQQRQAPLQLERNLNKTLIVESLPGGAKGPGYYCDLCKRLCKDSMGYLDHINGRMHLRRLGQTTQVARSTVEQVRARIARLRAQTLERSEARAYDFDERLREIAERQRREREEKKARRRAAAAARAKRGGGEVVGGEGAPSSTNGGGARRAAGAAGGGGKAVTTAPAEGADAAMMAAMGFGGFGTTKKR